MNKKLVFIFFILTIPFVTSCTFNHAQLIGNNLKPSKLYESFQTKPINLKVRSQCKELPTVTLVNDEKTGTNIIGFVNEFNNKELMDHVVNYIGDAFIKCGINVSNNSDKIIKMSLKDMKYMLGVWSQGASVELLVNIPAINYSESYIGIGNAYGGTDVAAAYAIHEATWSVIKDPVIQDYILCKNRDSNEGLPVRESALDILKKRYASGEITKEQFEQMKKDIQ